MPGILCGFAAVVLKLASNGDQTREMGSATRAYVVRDFNRSDQAQEFVGLVSRLKNWKNRISMIHRLEKRIFDLVLVILGLAVLLPFLLCIALAVRLKLGSPVLFSQQRPGLHGKPFTFYKFRTMTDVRDPDGNSLPFAERLTSFGRFLRSNSLYELPELFNVLKGDMSLVGPRPLIMQYLDRCTSEQALRRFVLMSQQDRNCMGERGREYALKNLEWSVLGKRYADLCESLVGNKETSRC